MAKRIKSSAPKETPSKKEKPSKAPPPPQPGQKPPGAAIKNYPLRGALIFLVAHVLLVIFIVLWGFEKSMFIGQGGHFLLYLIELLGVELARVLGEAESLEVVAPYAIAFFANTIFYAAVGYGVGYLFQHYGWVKETRDIFLTEEEQAQKQLIPPKP